MHQRIAEQRQDDVPATEYQTACLEAGAQELAYRPGMECRHRDDGEDEEAEYAEADSRDGDGRRLDARILVLFAQAQG